MRCGSNVGDGHDTSSRVARGWCVVMTAPSDDHEEASRHHRHFPVCKQCTPNASHVCKQCTPNVSHVCKQCTPNASHVCKQCTPNASHVCKQCTPNVSHVQRSPTLPPRV